MRKHTKKIISLLLGFTMAVCMFLMPGVATRAEAANSIPEFRSSISHSMKTQTGGKLIPADTVLADAPNCVVVVTGTVENIGTASEMGTTGTKIIVEIDSNIPGNPSDIKGTFHNYIPGGSPEAYDVSVAGSYDYSNRTVTFDFGDGQYGCSLFNNPGDSFEFEIGIIRVPYVSDSYDFVNTVYVQHDDVYSGSEILTGTGRTRTAESIDSFKSQRLESAGGKGVYLFVRC